MIKLNSINVYKFMELKELIDKSLEYVNDITSYEVKDDIYFISIDMNENKKETLRIYKDYIETEISKEEIIVIDTNIELKDNTEIDFIDDYNKESFFSKVYLDDDNFLIIEACSLYENTNPKSLYLVINEISNTAYNIKLDLLEMEA